jgi:hypothetical protein
MPQHLQPVRLQTLPDPSQARSSTSHRSAVVNLMRVSAWVGLFALAGLSGCASAGPYNPSDLPPPQLSQVQELCHSVMGIPPGIGLSSDCVENLSNSAVALSGGRTLQGARRACLRKGLAPGQLALSQCELTAVSQPSAPEVRVDTSGLQRPAKSYFNASFDEVRRREQDVCARLGYDPIDGSFTQCVGSLDAALFASTHPMQ